MERFDENKTRGGRPRVTLQNGLTETAKFRLTIQEKEELRKAAKASKKSMSNYIRDKISAPSSTPSFSPDALSALSELITILDNSKQAVSSQYAERFKSIITRIAKAMES